MPLNALPSSDLAVTDHFALFTLFPQGGEIHAWSRWKGRVTWLGKSLLILKGLLMLI